MFARATYTGFIVALAATLFVLDAARAVLTPLVVAFFLWLFLNAVARGLRRGFDRLGIRAGWVAKLASVAAVTGALLVVLRLVGDGIAELRLGLPLYQIQIDILNASLGRHFGIEGGVDLERWLGAEGSAGIALSLAGSAADLLATLFVVVIYLAFIHVETGVAEAKLAALVAEPADRARITEVCERVLSDIETYVGLKTLIGLVQAVPTWLILTAFDVDAPALWAILVFVFSFVPTIGTLVGMVFPAAISLLEYGSWPWFFAILAALAPIQIVASNWLEPRLLGDTFNLSPLVVFFGLFAGGALWGVTGAVVIVPMLAIAMIVFARIPALRPVAVAISGDGKVEAAPGLRTGRITL